jgi:hypothetical protein
MGKLYKEFSSEKKQAFDQLKTKLWFQGSRPEVQLDIAKLPDSFTGFLEDLAGRPDQIGELKVNSLEGISRGNFAVIPKFNVVNEKNGEKKEYTYEYVSWRQGPNSGSKGIIFVEDKKGKITDFIVMRGDKFATGQPEWDLVGGFPRVEEEGVKSSFEIFAREAKEELGLSDIKLKRVIELGKVKPDAGMTNNNPNLFAAVIDGSEAKKSREGEGKNLDAFELSNGPVILPIEKLKELISRNEDGYFLSTVSRLADKGVIDIGVKKDAKGMLSFLSFRRDNAKAA